MHRLQATTTPVALRRNLHLEHPPEVPTAGPHGTIQIVHKHGGICLDVQSTERGTDGHLRRQHAFTILPKRQIRDLIVQLSDAVADEHDERQLPLRLAA